MNYTDKHAIYSAMLGGTAGVAAGLAVASGLSAYYNDQTILAAGIVGLSLAGSAMGAFAAATLKRNFDLSLRPYILICSAVLCTSYATAQFANLPTQTQGTDGAAAIGKVDGGSAANRIDIPAPSR